MALPTDQMAMECENAPPTVRDVVRKLHEDGRGATNDVESSSLFDWSAICRTLETAFASDDSARNRGSRCASHLSKVNGVCESGSV
ncbi:unnamed protein product [Heligmosomoides polygyrus]|uniref:Uncharacterized protein n=1 Tax=Heligmosomoides polygyrus TaxID=6339 RepID=A0A183GQK2_HELPZ|nr:unnamed protein product [Heligmosomoides polygyrus]